MGFENYIADAPSPVERYWDLFAQNSERRFLITSMKGQDLVGVPTLDTMLDRTHPDACFNLVTAARAYRIPYKHVAWIQELVPGARASDGLPQVPEPCMPPRLR